VCSLTLAYRDRDKVTESAQLHQIPFDESAHILSVNSCHWNSVIDDPEQTSLAMVRINKQIGAILAKCVRGTSEHIPSTNILSALSDNCNGMDGKYNGAMPCFWRLLRQEDDCIRLVSVASRQIQCMPQAEESALDALAMLAEDDVSTSDERICRRSRMICTSHSFDNGHKVVGPAL
jgi:hypothetical protein